MFYIIIGILAFIAIAIFVFFGIRENYINSLILEDYIVEIDISNKRVKGDYNSQIEMYFLDEENRALLFSERKAYKDNIHELNEMIENETNRLKLSWQKEALIRQKENYIPLTINFVRGITRYKQKNGVRCSYQDTNIEKTIELSNKKIDIILKKLEKINFATTTKKYNEKNQRKLMTPILRKEIMERDNYTCQNCGKYLKEDTTNLHIDHIIPVSKGGKTIPENLQCLCASCNLKKSNK